MFSRLLIGLLLIITVLSSFYYNLDYFLIVVLITMVSYDLYISKIAKINLIIFLFTIFVISLLIPIHILSNAYVLVIFFTIIIIFNNKYKKELFSISIYLFCIILFYFIEVNRNTFYILILLSFFNDTVAYISGRSIGGPLIIPKISPKKTWSGTVISFLSTSLILYYLDFNILILIIISSSFFFGDIFFSYIKRKFKLKDFSNIIPGHGGILDRLDSFIFPVIFTYIIV